MIPILLTNLELSSTAGETVLARFALLACCCALLAAATATAAAPDKPALTEKELAERCQAALSDIRAYCASDLRPQGSSVPYVLPGLRPVQAPPRAPNPGSERPALPRSDESFNCLNARLRAEQYCIKQAPEAAGKTAFLQR